MTATTQLNEVASAYKFGEVSKGALREQLLQTRLAYKGIAFIWAYRYPAFTEEHINGVPLLHIERYDTRPFVLPPEGLQVLDELIFSEEADPAQIQILAKKLHTHTGILLQGFEPNEISAGMLIEAMRAELISMFTLGLTGFDTPGSVNAIPEASATLEAIQETSSLFLGTLEPTEAVKMTERFKATQDYFKQHTDFDTFDRLLFLKEHLNPLYEDLLRLRLALGEPAPKELSGRNLAVDNLFAPGFLDPYFYTELSEKEDSPALRQLGKKLFYDPGLSSSGQMSCASCHDPHKAFTDGAVTSRSNVLGQHVLRNAPTLLNAVYADRYFYDLRAFTLEQQAEHVIFNQQEFNTAYEEIVDRLKRNTAYRALFKTVFGDPSPTREGFARALASYVLSLQSFNSPFDRYVRNERNELDPKVKEGFNLFMGKAACGTCHFAPTFSGLVPPFYTKNESEILGVLAKPKGWGRMLDGDMGRYENGIYSEQSWIYERSFKTSTVRNVSLTAPYFHHGGYKTLEQVVDFYDHGGGAGLGLEVKNQTLPADSLHLNASEKEALIAFMHALTDTSVVRE